MNKTAPSFDRASVLVSDAYQNWRPSQTWLTEMIRTVASRMFAQTNEENGDQQEKLTTGFHRGALTSQVTKLFGVMFDENNPRFTPSLIIDLLVDLDDLADIGHGYYLPRESRVVRLTESWGRIAGGLPLELSEHSDKGFNSIPCETIGRVVRMESHFGSQDRGTEHSEVFRWLGKSVEQWFADLCEDLPERATSAPPQEATVYYNAESQRSHSRGNRWQNRLAYGTILIARTGTQPTHYSVRVQKPEHREFAWFDLNHPTHQDARKWLLLAERIAGATNRVSVNVGENMVSLMLPDMLPRAWNTALFACACSVVSAEKGWLLEIPKEAIHLADAIFRSANIKLI